MSSELDHLRKLDHVELREFLAALRPVPATPEELERLAAQLPDVDPDGPIEVLPPLRHVA